MESAFLKEINSWINKHPSLPNQYLHVVLEGDSIDIHSLHRCIVFIHTDWSGPSHFGITNFLSAISQIENFNVHVYFVDLNSKHDVVEAWATEASLKIRCAGETFWMINGKTCGAYQTAGWDQVELIKSRIELFMQVE